ncbi:MAG: hypothetical protein Q4E46_00195 [Candidatus Saccharibacteria bacterium]|nr:hypothetical protein [Candidatus Saccharibacteria bacterium]
MAEKVYYWGEGDENTFHNTEVDRLREAEDAAGEDFSEFSNGDYNSEMNNRRSAENRPILLNGRPVDGNGNEIQHHTNSGYWRGKGREANEVNSGAMKKKRRFGPAALIIMALFGAGGVAFMGTSLGPFALVGNALDQFNVMRTAMNRRSTYFMRFQMDETLNTSLTNRRFGIFSAEKFKISNKMQKKLAKQSIEYKEDPDTKARYLVYTNQDTGEVSAVVANDGDMQKLTGKTLTNKDGASASRLMMMDDALGSDDNFFAAHQSATKTMKGHIVGWFESLTEAFHTRIGNLRNRFFGTTDETTEEDVKKKASAGGLAESVEGSEGSQKKQRTEEYDDYDDLDDDGNPKRKTRTITEDIGGADSLADGMDAGAVKSALQVKAEKASAAVGGASKVQGIVCGVINAVGAINLAITAIQVAKVLNFVTGMLEAVQRTQIGDGGSEMMVYFNNFSKESETEVWSGSDENIDKQVVSNKSTMASAAYNATFGGPQPDPDDPSVAKFNRDNFAKYAYKNMVSGGAFDQNTASGESSFSSLMGEFAGTVLGGANNLQVYQACLYSGIALSGISAVVDGVLLFATFGIGNLVKSLIKGIVQAAISIAITVAITAFISWIVPRVAQWLATDLIEHIGGEDSANALRSGFNMYMGKSMESNSGAVGNEAAVMAMYRETQEVIAEDARYDRATRSPFDPTSKHTFIGSLVQKLLPVANMLAGNSMLRAAGSMVSTTSNSMLSLFPSANAASDTWYEVTLNKDCPNLSALNLVGDAYCNPYYTTDFSTISMDPYKVVEKVGDSNFEEGEVDNPKIKKDSELGKYIVACTLRDSQYGIKDAMVQSFIEAPTSSPTLNSIIDAGTGAIPILGSLYDAAQGASEAMNFDWNTGKACIQDESFNSNWAQNKYYQRYIEDQTLMEAAGIIDESNVTAFVREYYEENPIDNSLEGVIARYSGMTKEQASNTVALLEYVDFIANYNPSDAYPLPVEEAEPVAIMVYHPVFVDEPVEVASVKYVVYADLRNRVQIV